jgi:phosphomannomutase
LTSSLALDGNGRVVVRYSGTGKLARIMIEAESGYPTFGAPPLRG